MKAIIWIGCILSTTILMVIIKNAGVTLGAIPTMLIYGAMFGGATALCKLWDRRRYSKRERERKFEEYRNDKHE